MCKQHVIPDALLENATAVPNALIKVKAEDGCQKCGSTDPNRAFYVCPNPECNFRACGHCLVQEPLSARMAECPKCHKRHPWPQ